MAISAADVMKLRNTTNAPMMDCKAALEKAEGDFQKAIQILREQNKAIASKKSERETAEGRIGIFIDGASGAAGIVEVRCESAPSAKTPLFVELTNDLAKHVATAKKPAASVDELLGQPCGKGTVRDRIEEVVGTVRENMKPARCAQLKGGVFGSYVHFDGSVGVLLQCAGTGEHNAAVLRDVCMHIAARQPVSASRDDVDPKVLEREREIARNQAAQTGKPANIVEKIAEGKLKTWFVENVLVDQPFVKDDTKTVGDLLKGAGFKVTRFIRYKVGELTG
jgi:elongation factor Ts